MYESSSDPLLTPAQFAWRLVRHLGVIAVVVVISLVIGMAGYVALARMSWVDAFLNSAMLLGGMGPVGDLPTTAAKIFAGCYALYAGIVFIASIGIMIAPIAHRILHKFHADDDDDDEDDNHDGASAAAHGSHPRDRASARRRSRPRDREEA